MTSKLDDLNAVFANGLVSFQAGNGNLTCARIATPHCTGEVYLHGAHVTAFQPVGHRPVLWMSQSSCFDDKKPIRGGIPICFPWFGSHANDNTLPAHGWARIKPWEVVAVGKTASCGAKLELQTEIDPFRLCLAVTFAETLDIELRVTLPLEAIELATFEEALHTYLTVGDIRRVEIAGLSHVHYLDKVGEVTEREASKSPIRFEGETDRVYQNTRSTCTLIDPVLKRRLEVSKWGSGSTVVWNPWIDKSKRMPDFGDDEWPGMVCIETANIRPNHIELRPGQIHTMRTRIAALADV
jgi:glucose-6-phosphate 1-epimerase